MIQATRFLMVFGATAMLSALALPGALAQDRTLDDVKQEVLRRTGRIQPFDDVRPEGRSPGMSETEIPNMIAACLKERLTGPRFDR